eukprot:GHVP01007960.1.p1 GENE.GHVP01007960.1~~GHVP01007960.1.p1  ORF type:complete len:120 (-),score=23.19 GHVP01007960.1:3-362(-)
MTFADRNTSLSNLVQKVRKEGFFPSYVFSKKIPSLLLRRSFCREAPVLSRACDGKDVLQKYDEFSMTVASSELSAVKKMVAEKFPEYSKKNFVVHSISAEKTDGGKPFFILWLAGRYTQ